MKRKRIVVMGYMGGCPIAGVIWQHLHYIVGLQRLGHDVYYVEDSARTPYDPVRQTFDADYSCATQTLATLGERFGFSGHWAFCARWLPNPTTVGMSLQALRALYKEADAILNVCGSQELHDDLLASDRIILVESDPTFLQVKADKRDQETIAYLRRHHRLFTFGENVGTPLFPVPVDGFEWLPTRQPVVTEFWATERAPPAGARLTTITNWSALAMIEWRKQNYYWSKSVEFMKFVDVPGCTGEPLELMANIPDDATRALFVRHHWHMRSPDEVNLDVDAYRGYIQASKGEFTASKENVVRLNTAWFSDRSACYLAAGRPVITQDTGFTRLYGGKAGLFAFKSMAEIVDAIARINADYAAHSQAAAAIAKEYFEATTVLRSLLERADI